MVNKQNILIVGAGYVGSASAISLSLIGHQVYIYDSNPLILKNFSKQILPFPDLDLVQGLAQLKENNNYPKTVSKFLEIENLQIILICVGTPIQSEGDYNLSQLQEALASVFQYLNKENNNEVLIVIRSTLPPNCMTNFVYPLVEEMWSPAKPAPSVIYFPEFLREGCALADLKNPPLSVVGVDHEFTQLDLIISCFGISEDQVKIVKTAEAEMVKISSNIFHALKVSFANEISRCCKVLKIDSYRVLEAFCLDTKLNISSAYLTPGFSFGGPCLDKELKGLISIKNMESHNLPVLESIRVSNEIHFDKIVADVKQLKYRKLGIVGLAFKSESNDQRNSPICKLIDQIKNDFQVYSFEEQYEGAVEQSDFYQFASTVDAVLLGSKELSDEQIGHLAKNNKPILDLALNKKNRLKLQHLKQYGSVV